MISYVIPTRDRPEALARTLAALGARAAGAEVIVVDDAPVTPAGAPRVLMNGAPVRLIRRRHRGRAAARNAGARRARGDWLVMLDDDSYPLDDGHVAVLTDAPADVAAIGAEILLPGGRHEFGGLPEVFVGCGVAIRRDVFLALGGYDRSLGLYAEEYDLAARIIAAGSRIAHDWRFRVRHEKVARHRDANSMLRRLVRNNGWVMQRYAPEDRRAAAIEAALGRCARVAEKERALGGFSAGMCELRATIGGQPRRPLSFQGWERFTGAAQVRSTLLAAGVAGVPVSLVHEGKGGETVRGVLSELGCRVVEGAPMRVIATLSPGPMIDAWRRCVTDVLPWRPGGLPTDGCRDPAERGRVMSV